ncbi:DnaJ-domain-containing protein [Lentinula aciculospora]|uniref:DnaJ-domain-containing protein n=1 Tax=Lentinula aciculospora TaxID=153920 RepID=A0A9W9A5Z9_9AGAR|nr:DnaJ-domain-containing protein [Lentinula aciculospora]
MPTLYQILGIRPSATAGEVRRAYKQRALETHPDKLEPGSSNEEKERAERSFREVHDAFVILGDAEKRKAYDIRTHVPNSLSYQKASDEAKRRMEDRAEWQRQQQEQRKASMAEIREQNRIAMEKARERRFKAAEQAALVKNMVDELLQLTPEWEQRKLNVQQRRASRLNSGNLRWSTVR